MTATKVVIIGGGIAGLCAAYDLHQAGCDVTLHEAGSRFGGKIKSSKVGHRIVDAGPDSFPARLPQGRQLCEDLGLASEITSPVAPIPSLIHRDGKLFTPPKGTVLGIPTDFEALAESGLISPDGIARAAEDLELPSTTIGDDASVGTYFRARLGDEVTDWLIEPTIGASHASDINRLSLRASSPVLWDIATSNRSIIKGLREARGGVGSTQGSAGVNEPIFSGLPGGIYRIVERLLEELSEADLRLNSPVEDLDSLEYDHLVMATPAQTASKLLETISPDAAELLGGIEYSSLAQVTVEFAKSALSSIPETSMLFFPAISGGVLSNATWLSNKWAHYAETSGHRDTALIRLTSGRSGDGRAIGLDDDTLTSRLISDFRTAIQVDEEPLNTRVVRWPEALPHYAPGHATRSEEILAAVTKDAPNIQLVGAAYAGTQLPVCIGSGRDAAARILA